MSTPNPIILDFAKSSSDVAAVKALFQEYADWLDVPLCFQGFAEEMAGFPAKYDILLLARVEGEAAGAIGSWTLEPGICEMKRLYVRPGYRGLGLGARLCERLMTETAARGFHTMRLDTLSRLTEAIGLYREYGFEDRSAYYDNPLDGVIYMERPLKPPFTRTPSARS